MRLHPPAQPVPDGPHFDFALEGAEGRFGFGQLGVGGPQFGRIFPRPVGAQQIRPFGARGLLKLGAVPVPVQDRAAGLDFELQLEPAPSLGMAFAQPADRLLDQGRVFELARAYSPAQGAQVAKETAHPAPVARSLAARPALLHKT